MTISVHARERAFLRYGIILSKRRWKAFSRAVADQRKTIRLSGDRRACRFEGNWYLLVCGRDDSVLTFLPWENLTEQEKILLDGDERYRRTTGGFELPDEAGRPLPDDRSGIAIPETIPEDAELPHDFYDADTILRSLCSDQTRSEMPFSSR